MLALFQYYESLLSEAKAKRESSVLEAVEKAVTSRMQDIQNDLEKCLAEKKAVLDVSYASVPTSSLWCLGMHCAVGWIRIIHITCQKFSALCGILQLIPLPPYRCICLFIFLVLR